MARPKQFRLAPPSRREVGEVVKREGGRWREIIGMIGEVSPEINPTMNPPSAEVQVLDDGTIREFYHGYVPGG